LKANSLVLDIKKMKSNRGWQLAVGCSGLTRRQQPKLPAASRKPPTRPPSTE
jgi:hypothetical protein